MTDIDFKDNAQSIVYDKFRQVKSVQTARNVYKIAIVRNEIPVVERAEIVGNNFFIRIKYDSNEEIQNICDESVCVQMSNSGDICGIDVYNIDRLKEREYRIGVKRSISSLFLHSTGPEDLKNTDAKEIIRHHKQKRIIDSFSEVLKMVPNEIR